MLCPKCGFYSDREESVCPECGNILQLSSGIPSEGPQAIRQGKRAREAVRMKQDRPAPVRETAGRRFPAAQRTAGLVPGRLAAGQAQKRPAAL